MIPHRPSVPRAFALLGALCALLCGAAAAVAQQPLGTPAAGPVIEGFGAVFDLPAVDLETPVDMEYRVFFDVSRSGERGAVNQYLNTVARFLNIHARAGVPLEGMRVALVLHGEAAADALRPGPFRERFGTDNPNHALLLALAGAGVDVWMCGQSLMARGLPPEELAEPVGVALSAMTAVAVLKERGYRSVN